MIFLEDWPLWVQKGFLTIYDFPVYSMWTIIYLMSPLDGDLCCFLFFYYYKQHCNKYLSRSCHSLYISAHLHYKALEIKLLHQVACEILI